MVHDPSAIPATPSERDAVALLERHDACCDGSCRGTDGAHRPAVQGYTVCSHCGIPTWGEELCTACAADPWATLRGLDPLEQWNADGNR